MKSNRHQLTKQKLHHQQRQTQTILIDYEKAKQNCINNFNELQLQFQNLSKYEAIQRQTQLKIKILDLHGLVALKNQLVKSLGELYELQEKLDTKKKRKQLAKQLNSSQQQLLMTKNLVKSQMNTQFKRIKSLQRGEIQDIVQMLDQSDEEHKNGNRNKYIRKYNYNRGQNKNSAVDIPVYRPKQQTIDNKVDRISKYLAALKRNMKHNTAENMKNNKLREQILAIDPQFNNMIQQLQIYRKKQDKFHQAIENQANAIFNKMICQFEPIEQGQQSIVIKIGIEDPPQNSLQKFLYQTLEEISQQNANIQEQYDIVTKIRRELSEKANHCTMYNTFQITKNASQIQNEEQYNDIQDLKQEFSKQNMAIESVVNKITDTLENSQKKLIQLRQRRKKLLCDQDLWGDDF